MNELIPINYEDDAPTVSGRELHAALGVTTRYNDWFSRMCEYGFREGKDFYSFLSKTPTVNGRPATDHQLTIPMAKELCMLQRSEAGKRFRQYFLDVEAAWNSPDRIMERALAIAHQRALEAERRIFALSAENEELAVALNTSLEYWTVMKYNTAKNMQWTMQQCQGIGRRMSAFCRMNGFEIKTCLTNDDRFPSVNSYPVTAWERFMRHTGEQPRIGRNSYHA